MYSRDISAFTIYTCLNIACIVVGSLITDVENKINEDWNKTEGCCTPFPPEDFKNFLGFKSISCRCHARPVITEVRTQIRWVQTFRQCLLTDEDYKHMRDCADVKMNDPSSQDGVYTIDPQDGQGPFQVYCDMTTDGGGWTVFQNRNDGSEDFFRTWSEYKEGFGNLCRNFWLGNDKIHRLTTARYSQLRIDMVNESDAAGFAKYSTFSIDSEAKKYRLHVSGFSGDREPVTDSDRGLDALLDIVAHNDITDSQCYAIEDAVDISNMGGPHGPSEVRAHATTQKPGNCLSYENGHMFTTKDQDNDEWGQGQNCAHSNYGGWWYKTCHQANLNGLYGSTYPCQGLNWVTWTTTNGTLKQTGMKVKPA